MCILITRNDAYTHAHVDVKWLKQVAAKGSAMTHLRVVAHAEKTSNREAERNFGVGESSVRDWRKQKDKLEHLPAKRSRLFT